MLFAVATMVALWLQTEVRLWLPAGALFPDLVLILAVVAPAPRAPVRLHFLHLAT